MNFFRRSIPFLFALLLVFPVGVDAMNGKGEGRIKSFLTSVCDHLRRGSKINYTKLRMVPNDQWRLTLTQLGTSVETLHKDKRDSDKQTVLDVIQRLRVLFGNGAFSERWIGEFQKDLLFLGDCLGASKPNRQVREKKIEDRRKLKDYVDGERRKYLEKIKNLQNQFENERNGRMDLIRRLNVRIEQLQAEIRRLNQQIKQNDFDNKFQKINQDKLKDFEKKNNDARNELLDRERRIKELEAEIRNLQDRIRRLEKDLLVEQDKSLDDKQKQHVDRDGLNRQIRELQGKIKKSDDARAAAIRAWEELRKERDRLQNQIAERDREIKNLREQLERERRARAAAEQEIIRLKADIEKLNNLLSRERDEVKSSKESGEKFQQDLKDLENRFSNSKNSDDELNKLRKRYRELERKHAKAEVEFYEIHKKLQKQIKNLMQVLRDSRLISSDTHKKFDRNNGNMSDVLKVLPDAITEFQKNKRNIDNMCDTRMKHLEEENEKLKRQLEDQRNQASSDKNEEKVRFVEKLKQLQLQHQREMELLKADLSENKLNMDERVRDNRNFASEINRLKNENERLKREKDGITNLLSRVRSFRSSFDNGDPADMIQKLLNDMEKLGNERLVLERENKKLLEDYNNRNQEFERQKNEFENIQNKISEKEEENKNLREQAQNAFQIARKKASELKNELKKCSDEKSSDMRLSTKNKEIRELKEKIEEIQEENKGIRDLLNKHKKRSESTVKQLEGLRDRLMVEKSDLRKKLEEEKKQKDREISKIERSKKKKENRLKKTMAEMEKDKNNKIHGLEKLYQQSNDEIKQLRDIINKKEQQETDIFELTEKLAKLEAEAEKTSHLERELVKDEKSVGGFDLPGDWANWTHVKKYRYVLKKLLDKRKEMETQNRLITNKQNETNDKFLRERQKNDELKRENDRLKQENKRLEKK